MQTFINQAGVRLTYEMTGEGDPVVFIHPPAMGRASFRHLLNDPGALKVIAMDGRGHGGSSTGTGEFTMETWCHDLVQLLDHLAVERIVVCGYSSGGMTALTFALMYPERCKGLVLLGGFPDVNSVLLREEFRLGLLVTAGEHMRLLAEVLAKAHTKDPDLYQEIKETALSANVELVHQLYLEQKGTNLIEKLPFIDAPIWLVYGKRDKYVHSYLADFYFHATQARIHPIMIDKVGHQIPTKKSEALRMILERVQQQVKQFHNDVL
ncbi:alpha/beta fold hydrolase [Salsuginibacillus kocurii]|uniref:alpha/beta fold hydrolase n=1 Tax=Salsuginibacillus kocurii TaxID=427078 RepID=UPI000372CF3A|nr:alpha/beta hydrolase [Salsuginibacillus kocurii]